MYVSFNTAFHNKFFYFRYIRYITRQKDRKFNSSTLTRRWDKTKLETIPQATIVGPQMFSRDLKLTLYYMPLCWVIGVEGRKIL